MEGGFPNNDFRVGAIIQVRNDSKRLPGKALLNLPFISDVSFLGRIILSLKEFSFLDEIVVSTSSRQTDDIIANESKYYNAKVFRGDKNNVLKRYFETAKKFNLDYIFRVTGDNPFVFENFYYNIFVDHINKNCKYSTYLNLPLGLNVELISFSALEHSFFNAFKSNDKEHVTSYIKKNFEESYIYYYDFNSPFNFGDLRLTVDYPNDYLLVDFVYQLIYFNKIEYSFESVLQLFNDYPWLKSVNNFNKQVSP
ncbi:MAG: cytidylyltransferase domain-containing protein [Flavobacteriales bacterium]